MPTITLTDADIDDIKNPEYWRAVLINLLNNAGEYVRFGLVGEGKFPNYQVHTKSGRVLRFSGMSHNDFPGKVGATFDEANLTKHKWFRMDLARHTTRAA